MLAAHLEQDVRMHQEDGLVDLPLDASADQGEVRLRATGVHSREQ